MRNPLRRSQDRLTRRLSEIRLEIVRLKKERAVLDEQVTYLQQVEADAQTDAVVADTGPAQRAHRAARSDLRRAARQREELQQRIDGLLAEQDTLLDRLLPTDDGG